MSWKLDRYTAIGRCDGPGGQSLVVQIDAERPTPGIVQADWCGQRIAGLWQEISGNLFESPPAVEEVYVRGRDLVCRYCEHPGTKLTATVYWRLDASSPTGAAAIDLRLAVQTSTLGTQPQAAVSWHLPHGRLTEFGLSETLIDRLHQQLDQPISFLDRHLSQAYRIGFVQLEEAQVTVIPLVHLSDDRERTFSSDGEAIEIRHSLNLELLEKGVIRTARVRCLLSGRELTPAELMDEAVRFFESDLPLTT